MQLGLFTPVFGELSFDQLLAELKSFPQITALELGCGGWPGSSHIDPEALLASDKAREYRQRLADAGLSISALSCHGNPIHPEPAIGQADTELLRRTILLAEALEVRTVITFSGCPGAGPGDATPNWITAVWPPEFSAALAWQWEQRLLPFWRPMERFAADHGVRIALEAHPGFCVYNPATMLRLRAECGAALGMNFDPSHLWWQGIEPAVAISELGQAIFHVHAKDVALLAQNVHRNGVLDTKPYTDIAGRAWSFRTVGWGHDEAAWKALVSALRLAGYDGVLSIEHEDALLSVREGLTSAIALLSRVLLRESPVTPWWT